MNRLKLFGLISHVIAFIITGKWSHDHTYIKRDRRKLANYKEKHEALKQTLPSLVVLRRNQTLLTTLNMDFQANRYEIKNFHYICKV